MSRPPDSSVVQESGGTRTHAAGLDRTVLLIREVAGQVLLLHESGRLHLRVDFETIQQESERGAILGEPTPTVRLGVSRADLDDLPRELHGVLPLELPTDLAAAELVLRGKQVRLDPRLIDVHQLGALTCRCVADAGPGEYLRSARVKARVPLPLRSLLERAWGADGRPRFADMASFREALNSLDELLPQSRADPPSTNPGVETPRVFSSPGSVAAVAEGPPRQELRLDCESGTRLGNYELLEQIGAGGMGEVYLAHDPALNRRVAVKVLPAELARHSEFVQRFYAEASAAARVMHPNVIPIHFIGEDRGHHFFVMQFVEGETLACRLSRESRLSVEETLAIADDVLAGLQAAHAQGLIHRDIKPGNILLESSSGRAIVADFGLVKSAEAGGGRTATGVVLGTVDYMSPEQGRGRVVDHRCDLYSAGVLLYQMASGRLPFAADSATGMIFQHVYERPTPLPELVPDLPISLWSVIARLMAKSPALRYSSAQSVRDDLQALQCGDALPSATDPAGIENYWRPVVSPPEQQLSTRIIQAPVFQDEPEPSSPTPATGWWRRTRERCEAWWYARKPEWIESLETTQLQAQGAISEFQRRQKKLRRLVEEAESVLCELNVQQAQELESGELEPLIRKQCDELDSMRIGLARVEATLQRLCAQRDLLNARLLAARARGHLLGARPKRRTRFLVLPSLQQAGLLGVLATIFVVVVYLRWPEFSGSIPAANTRTGATSSLIRQSASAPGSGAGNRSSNVERRLAISRDGVLAVVAQHLARTDRLTAAAVDSTGDIELTAWDLTSGVQSVSFADPHDSQDLALSADRSLLLSSGQNHMTGAGEIRLWNVATGELRHRIDATTPTAGMGVGFAPDLSRAYALLGSPEVRELGIVDCRSGQLTQFPLSKIVATATAFAVSPSADVGAVAITQTGSYGPPAIHIYDLKHQRLVNSLQLSGTGRTQSLAFSGDGRLLAASSSGNIYLIDTKTWTETAALEGHGQLYDRVALSDDGRFVAQSRSGSVQLWNIGSRSVVPLIPGTTRLDIAFSPGETLIVTSAATRFSFFDATSGKELLGLKRASR